MTQRETRRWTFDLDDGPHVIELGDDSVWTDRPVDLMLDGARLKIGWQRTTSWWRSWNVARLRWDFLVGTHRATLAYEVRQPPRARTRLRLILGGRQEIRRVAYRLEIDGVVVPFRPGAGTARR